MELREVIGFEEGANARSAEAYHPVMEQFGFVLILGAVNPFEVFLAKDALEWHLFCFDRFRELSVYLGMHGIGHELHDVAHRSWRVGRQQGSCLGEMEASRWLLNKKARHLQNTQDSIQRGFADFSLLGQLAHLVRPL